MSELTSNERADGDLIAAVLQGDTASFEPLVVRYSPRVFATARRYARRESEVEDIVQEVWSKAFHKLSSFRGEAPFEHWLMRMAVRTCYDFLRDHQRNRETSFTELSEPETDWLDRFVAAPETADDESSAARDLVGRAWPGGRAPRTSRRTQPGRRSRSCRSSSRRTSSSAG